MRLPNPFQRDPLKPGRSLLAFGILGMVSVAALGAAVSAAGDDATANDMWSGLWLFPLFLLFAVPAFLPIAFIVAVATGASFVAVRQSLTVIRYRWRGVMGGMLMVTCALSLVPLVRSLLADN
jgi:hypothetical protein